MGLSAIFERRAFFLGFNSDRHWRRAAQTQYLGHGWAICIPKAAPSAMPASGIFYSGPSTWADHLARDRLGERVGWRSLGAAGIGMLVGVLWFRLRGPKTLGAGWALSPSRGQGWDPYTLIGVRPARRNRHRWHAGLFTVNAIAIAGNVRNVMLVLAVALFLYLFLFAGLTTDEKKRVASSSSCSSSPRIFCGPAFEQAPTSLNLFAKDFTDRVIFRLGNSRSCGWA